MKSKVFCLALATLFGLASSADVLYWQVGADSGFGSYDQAYLMAKDSAQNLYYVGTSYGQDGSTVVSADGAVASSQFANGGYALGDLSQILSWDSGASNGTGASALSFYVELWTDSGTWVGQTGTKTYEELVSSGAIRDGLDANFSLNNSLGHASNSFTHDVPEPTSGLLMLIGLGALALRRRKVA